MLSYLRLLEEAQAAVAVHNDRSTKPPGVAPPTPSPQPPSPAAKASPVCGQGRRHAQALSGRERCRVMAGHRRWLVLPDRTRQSCPGCWLSGASKRHPTCSTSLAKGM